MSVLSESPFLKACRREKASVTPVWLMRQAGRYMKEYRAIRETMPFLELCKDTDLVTEITVHAQEKLGADAAIIFSDILLIVEPLGFSLDYLKGGGPTIRKAVRTNQDVERILVVDPVIPMDFLFEAIRKTRAALKPGVPLIGFAGAPFTVASYLIEGGSSKDFVNVKAFMHADFDRWNVLLDKITRVTTKLLRAQVAAGVQALQIFDSWAGCLTPEEYECYVLPHSQELIASLDGNLPIIHFGTKTGPFLDKIAQAGGDVIGIDHRIGLSEAWEKVGDRAVQGNMDPAILASGTFKEIESEVKRILKEVDGRPGHIFNLGHGVTPDTPVENAIAVVEMVHDFSHR